MLRAFTLALLVGCENDPIQTTNVNKDGELVEEVDEDAPEILHEAIAGTQTFGADVSIEATVTDADSGVLFVYLHYKNEIDGSADWENVILTAAGDIYSGTIRGSDHRGGGIDYYIEAVDRSQNSAFAPDDGESDPYHFRIAE
ncbi:MAG: hypothetical protein Q8P41_30525 [Pseudomonadota bacterium]|nr:hypothetical protein [Pseudomonadota bacterium]